MQAHSDRKRILVTGGAGFLGSHLVDQLLLQGHHVTCVDNLFTGSQQNIRHLKTHDSFTFIEHDIVQPLHIDVDEIYNLACPASPKHYQHDPIQTIKANVIGAANMLDLADRLGCRILQASTSEVYGDPSESPQREAYWGNVNPIGPRSCYDEGKRCAETLFFDYHRERQVDIKVARIFNTYGPRMHHADGRVVSNFIVQALSGDPITLYGAGSQTRAFCYVDDLIDGLSQMMRSDAAITGPINLGNPDEVSILALAQMIVEMTGSRSEITFAPLPKDDPKQRCPDISRARSELGWTPSTALEAGLQKTIAYFQGALS